MVIIEASRNRNASIRDDYDSSFDNQNQGMY